ncbi:hypothetical protein [Lichenibacterium dinghuense]|uniref:hypothetical protein n=1 Tax=Lichenibacterium dinghuense TaxID=2895977 RepID=UPI001F3AD6FA|nr:hypothetical protein [Lichenibacterium sp. 6Y81]
MLRFLLRAIGFVLVAAAFATLVVDGSRSIAGGRALFYTLGEIAAWLGGAHYAAALAAAGAWPGPAQRLVAGVLAVPGFAVTGALGLLLLYAGRPPAAGVGASSRRA